MTMNIKLFKEISAQGLSQNIFEWQIFLERVSAYFDNRGIANPIVVELGIWFGRQKRYYQQLLNAEHIGIDNHSDKGIPDILGDTHNENTVQYLKEILNGRSIDLLFIDAGHTYNDVKRDYKLYAPLTKGIIAIHDIMLEREEVKLFWNGIRFSEDYITETIHAPAKYHVEKLSVGIGLLINRW